MELIYIILSLVVIVMLLASFILPWINRSNIKSLFEEIEKLKNQSSHAANSIESMPSYVEEYIDKASMNITQKTEIICSQASNKKNESISNDISNESVSFEQQFGTRLPVWIGGVALALAGFFMVKYSIEVGLISPAVRASNGNYFWSFDAAFCKLVANKASIC